jgi:hypothetical protein
MHVNMIVAETQAKFTAGHPRPFPASDGCAEQARQAQVFLDAAGVVPEKTARNALTKQLSFL